MELVQPKFARRFLGFQTTPANGCFGNFLPLQSGLLMIAVIDILAGLLQTALKLLLAVGVYWLVGDVTTVPADISVCVPLFAIIGITGVRNLDIEKLEFYSYAKQIEFVVRFVNLFAIGLTLTPVIFLVYMSYCAYSMYCAYIVWSTYELVKSEEGMLVKHGQENPIQGFPQPSF